MSFTEYLVNLIIGEDEQPVKTEKEFRSTVANIRSVAQLRSAVDFFLQNQHSETTVEIFFNSKIISHMADAAIKYASTVQSDQTDLVVDSRTIEILRIFIHLVNSIENDLILNQLFSNNVICSFISTLHPIACRLPEYFLLLKAIALRLTRDNVNLFIQNESFELYRISCSLPLDVDNYHLKVVQKNIVLMIARCIRGSSFQHLSRGFLQAFMEHNIHVGGALDDVVDEFYFLSDFLDTCPFLVDDYYEKLPADLMLMAVSFDIIARFSLKLVGKFEMANRIVTLWDLFFSMVSCRLLIKNCHDTAILKNLNLAPAQILHKLTIMTGLLNSNNDSKQRPTSASSISSRKSNVTSSPLIPNRSLIKDLGPLDPTVPEDIELPPSLPAREEIPVEEKETAGQSKSTAKSRKRMSDYDIYNGVKLYEENVVSRTILHIIQVIHIENEAVESKLKQLVILAGCLLINELISNIQTKFYNFLKKEHQTEILHLRKDNLTATELPEFLKAASPLLVDYHDKPFHDFISKHAQMLTPMKEVLLNDSKQQKQEYSDNDETLQLLNVFL